MAIFKCGVCGYLHDGEQPPDFCPKCGAPREQFSELSADAEKLVVQSRPTNDLLVKIAALMDEAHGLALEGERENLDSPCVFHFQKCRKVAWEVRQACKAEMKAHMSKGQWG